MAVPVEGGLALPLAAKLLFQPLSSPAHWAEPGLCADCISEGLTGWKETRI